MTALASDKPKAIAIFATVRGLESKLALVSAALTGDASRLTRWVELGARVQRAFGARNQVAHARPRKNGGVVGIILSGPPGAPDTTSQIVYGEPAHMELVKRTRAKEVVWTEDMLRAEHASVSKLFGHLVAFTMELRGETPPAHLREEPPQSAQPRDGI